MDHNKKGNKQDFKSHYDKFIQAVKKAKKYLILGKPHICTEKAQKAVYEAKDQLGGENSVQLLPGLITMAEGNIEEAMQIKESIVANEEKIKTQNLEDYEILEIEEIIKQENQAKDDKLKKAEKSLVASFWNILKLQPSKDEEEQEEHNKKNQQNLSSDEILQHRCELSKVFVKLYLAQENYDSAQEELKNSIFTDSQKYGANHIITALSYYQMGQVLMKKGEFNKAKSFLGKTAEIFYKFFKYYFRLQEQMQLENQQFYNSLNDVDSFVLLDVISCCEKILQFFNNNYLNQNEQRKEVMKPILDCYRALALMHQFEPYDSQERQQDLNNSDTDNSFGEMNLEYRQKKYEDYMRDASFECMNWKGDEHPKTIRLKQIIESFGENYDNQQYEDQGQYSEQQQY